MGTEAKVDEVYKKNIRQFNRTQLCERVKQLVVSLFMQAKITKIVAFGLSTLTLFSDIRNTFWTPHLHVQHAALEAIRSVWEEHRPSETAELRIFIQDPQYCELDMKVAEIHKMEVVNSTKWVGSELMSRLWWWTFRIVFLVNAYLLKLPDLQCSSVDVLIRLIPKISLVGLGR